jgi:hypothetical protein
MALSSHLSVFSSEGGHLASGEDFGGEKIFRWFFLRSIRILKFIKM